MDKCDDSLQTEKELNKIIVSPKREKIFQQQPFSPENEYKLNKIENEIESIVNISGIKKENNNEHFFIEDSINYKKEFDNIKIENKKANNNIGERCKVLSNFLSMDNENYRLLKKNIQKNKKNNSSRSTINIFHSSIINKQNYNINRISCGSLPKYSKNQDFIIENKSIYTDRYKKMYKNLFSNNNKTINDNSKNMFLSRLFHKNLNINKLTKSNCFPNNKVNFYNKIDISIIPNYSNSNFNDKNSFLKQRLNKLDKRLKNSNNIFEIGSFDNSKNNHIEISDVNHLKIEKKIYDNNRKNNTYTLNEISNNFDRIFNIIENKVKNKQISSYKSMALININNQNNFPDLSKINYIKKKLLPKKSINNYLQKNNNINYQKNEYEKNTKSIINDIMNLKSKYL